jgi:tetratricopeptide (TPR) repeat protein
MHLRIGETMAKVHASELDIHAAEIAGHFLQAGAVDGVRTVDLLMLAGDRAIEAAAFDEALRYYEDALSLDPDDLATRADLLYGIGLAQRATRSLDEGVETWRRALDLYEELGDVPKEVTVIVDIANQLAWAGRWEEAVELATRGLQLIGEAQLPERARLLSITATAMGGAGLYESGMQLANEALGIAERLDDDLERGRALSTKAIVHWGFNEFEDSIEAADRSEPFLQRTGDLWTLANSIGFKVWSLCGLGDIEAVTELLPRLRAVAEKVGHVGGALIAMRSYSIVVPFEDIDEYTRRAWADFRLNEENGLPWIAQSHYIVGRAQMAGGDVEGGLAHFKIAMETDPPGITWGYALGAYFRTLTVAGRRDEAEAMIEDIRAKLPTSGAPITVGQAGLLRTFVEGLFELGVDDPGLLPLVEEVSDSKFEFNGRPVEMFTGLAAALAGDRAAAEAHLDSTAALCEGLGKGFERAEVLRMKGTIAARHGDIEVAGALFEEAHGIYDRLRFRFQSDLCRAKLASLNR